jgi:predicted Ser/Thr protein kinase
LLPTGDAPSDTLNAMIGSTFKQYRVEAVLGKGGMGEVYRARDTRLERSVALKLLPAEFTKDEDRKRRFFLEARAASAVTHPAIAQVYDADEVDGVAFIVMELVDGRTVRALLEKKDLDLLGALAVAIQVADGLAKAHEAGIVHRDLKPENVMLTPDGHAKILDFGLAKLVEPEASGNGDDMSHMETMARTQAGMVVGTLRYMSPEQARGNAVDHRSDLFSLGVLIYEMVTGQLPFSGKTPLDTLHAIAFEESRAATQVRPNLPPSLQRVLTRCLRKRSEDRYGSARDLASELRSVQKEVETGVSQRVALSDRLAEAWQNLRQQTPAAPWLAAAIAGAVMAVALYFVFSKHSWPSLILLGCGLAVLWRKTRNRRMRLVRKFAARAGKLPEVRIVAYEQKQITVLVDKALARTYLRLNTLTEELNASMFYGDPFTLSVRDAPNADDTRRLFSGSGVVYVRKDVLESEV